MFYPNSLAKWFGQFFTIFIKIETIIENKRCHSGFRYYYFAIERSHDDSEYFQETEKNVFHIIVN